MNEIALTWLQKFLFWFFNKFNKKLLQKYFPLIDHEFDISISNNSFIYISEKSNYCYLFFNITIKNYTQYVHLIKLVNASMILNNHSFFDFDKVILEKINVKSSLNLNINIPLTFYQVNLVKSMITDSNKILELGCNLNVSTDNMFGVKKFNKQINDRIEIRIN